MKPTNPPMPLLRPTNKLLTTLIETSFQILTSSKLVIWKSMSCLTSCTRLSWEYKTLLTSMTGYRKKVFKDLISTLGLGSTSWKPIICYLRMISLPRNFLMICMLMYKKRHCQGLLKGIPSGMPLSLRINSWHRKVAKSIPTQTGWQLVTPRLEMKAQDPSV